MDKEAPTYIEKVEIKGLWGRFDVNWDLNPDVNILVGENGTGKSTILEILHENLLANAKNFETPPVYKNHYEGLSTNKSCSSFKLVLSNRYILDPLLRSGEDYTEVGSIKSKYSYSLSRNIISHINTFEQILLDSETIAKVSNDQVRTTLDYYYYKLEKQFDRFEKGKYKSAYIKKDESNISLKTLNEFNSIVNQLFRHTNKKRNEDDDRLSFITDDRVQISPYDLSSGEKQLLIILLTVLMQDQQPSILIMDEPEISLHIRWQHQLIEIIRTLNPNCQLIIATHSPSIFNDGHREKVFWMNDDGDKGIISNSEKEEV